MLDLESVYVVHDFSAKNNDELTLTTGEKICILKKDEGFNDGWWLGSNEKGDVGLFPITHISKLPPGTVMTSRHVSLSSKNIQLTVQNSISHPLLVSMAIEEWLPDQVAFWLLHIGFEQEIADHFKEQEITGDVLLELNLESLKELEVSTFGKRFKLHHAINTLKQLAKNKPSSSCLVENDHFINRIDRQLSLKQQHQSTSPGSSKRNTTSDTQSIQETISGRISSFGGGGGGGRYSLSTMKMASNNNNNSASNNNTNKLHYSILTQPRKSAVIEGPTVDTPDMEGWLYKQADNPKADSVKGIINLKGYRIDVDEAIHSGRYCFKASHEKERTFYFYTEHEKSMKDWLKALMKATIERDYATPVMSSSTVPTVSLEQARIMKPRPPSILFQNPRLSAKSLSGQFSLTSISESDHSTGLKDSGYNGGRLSGSATDSSDSLYKARLKAIPCDLIDPQRFYHDNDDDDSSSKPKKPSDYVEWINTHMQQRGIQTISDLSSGTALLEFLENLTQKEIPRSIPAVSNQSLHAQKMDSIISVYRFMRLEGIELNGACTIRDVANGNETNIIHLLEAIKYWYNNTRQTKLLNTQQQ